MRLVRIKGRDNWHVQGTDNGKQWRVSLKTDRRDEADRLFRDFKREKPGELIGEIVAGYLKEKRGRRSHGSMETAWRALAPIFCALRPDQITRQLCRDYTELRYQGGVGPGTVLKDLGVLRAALRYSRKDQGAVFEFPPTPPPRERHITREEVGRLADACDLGHVKLFTVLAWCTAGRHSALLELTWARVDMEGRRISLASAGGNHGNKGRATVRINDWLLGVLREAYDSRTSDYVIEWGGKPLKSIKRSFAEAARKAGLEDVTPHVLRHSAAVALAGAGISMEKIAQVLGHTSTRVTERHYARFQPHHMMDAARALE